MKEEKAVRRSCTGEVTLYRFQYKFLQKFLIMDECNPFLFYQVASFAFYYGRSTGQDY